MEYDPKSGAEEELKKEVNEIMEIQRGKVDLQYGTTDYEGGEGFFMIQIDKSGSTGGRVIVAASELEANDIFERLKAGSNTAQDNDHIFGNSTFVISGSDGEKKLELADSKIERLIKMRVNYQKVKEEEHSAKGTFEQAA